MSQVYVVEEDLTLEVTQPTTTVVTTAPAPAPQVVEVKAAGPQGPTGAASTVPGPQGPTGATGPAGADATISANTKGYVNHGSTASTARPSGYGSVEWVGSVAPTNATNADTWINTA